MTEKNVSHTKWMKRAIFLASLGKNTTSPNPRVGAVILDKNGNLISEGFHFKAGMPHAEAMAFNNLKKEAKGGTMYDVSLSIGENTADYFIENTLNGSLGPKSPTSFNPGSYIQLEKNFNVDLVKQVKVDGWGSDLNVGYGLEFREEQFTVVWLWLEKSPICGKWQHRHPI